MARLVFAARIFPTKRTEAHNQAWRDHGDWTAWKYAMWERGEKFPSGRRPMKYATDRPYSDPEKAACRLMGQAQASNPSKMGRIYIEKINGPSCSATRARPRNTAPG
jgi:hypothetical protein